MKTLITLFRKVLGLIKSESEMSIDEYIESVKNRKQELSNISCRVYNSVKRNDDFEAAGNLVLA